ncbi:hypothetical protein [Sinorhizobium fredii]|uniref:hypothetical protein n=1 Tax=Rhizobium fredii TaxID=380 RepID=UPI0002D2D083|nr:hypothetical protein [Sinorhizobium fredii]
MFGHVDFEPRKPELVSNISGSRVQIPPDAHAAGPLSGHGSFIRPVFYKHGKTARLAKNDGAIECVRTRKVFDGLAINRIGLHGNPF